MSLYDPLEFRQEHRPIAKVDTYDDIPEDMDIFYRTIEAFLPEGKTLKDLTPEELKKIKAQYRFDSLRPGVYQGITGVQGMI